MTAVVTVAPDAFRGNFPAFSNMTTYPDPVINFWFGLSVILFDQGRWGALFDYGSQLFVAHNLSLEFNSNKAGKLGQNPGFVIGPVTAGTVDKVSYSRDPSSAMDPKNGHWNLSIYGLRYIRLVNMVGAGPVHLGAPLGADANFYDGAWPGPYL